MSKKSFDELVLAQEALGALGFVLDGNGYSKVYATSGNGQTVIRPMFSDGLSLDKTYKLVGFHVESYGIVPVSAAEPIQWDKFPSESVSDISSILVKLAPEAFMVKKKAKYIITAQCSTCAKSVESFLHMTGTTLCLKCASDMD